MVVTMDEQFIQAVLDTVDLIPYGRVATYGLPASFAAPIMPAWLVKP